MQGSRKRVAADWMRFLLKAPTTKSQAAKKLQAPSLKWTTFGTWDLGFFGSLGFGIWSFLVAVFVSTAFADTRTSADYKVAADTLNATGARQVSADYALDTSVSSFGLAAAFSGGDLKQGYLAQLL